MAEYRGREQAYPDEIQNTLAAFLGGIQKAHHANLLAEVDFITAVCKLKNIKTQLEAGLLTTKQYLTLMQSLPAIEYCDEEGFGLDTARVLMNMRVSAHTEEKKTDTGDVSTEASGHIGGVVAALGFGGSLKMTGHYSHSAEHASTSDYSAYTELEVTMKRTEPSPARRLTSQLMQEFTKDIGELAKAQVAIQKQKMSEELASQAPPVSIPETDDSTNGDDGGDGTNGDDGGANPDEETQ